MEGVSCPSFGIRIDILVVMETGDEKTAVRHVLGIINDLISNSLRCLVFVCAHGGSVVLPFWL